MAHNAAPNPSGSPPPLTIVHYRTPSSKPPQGTKRKRRWDVAGASGSSHSKIRNACIACREKKTRCSGHQPCLRCQQNNQLCEYMPIASRDADAAARNDGTTAREAAPPSSPAFTAASAATPGSREPPPSGRLDYPFANHPEGVLRGESPTRGAETATDESLQEDRNGHVHGGASEFAFLQLAKQKLAKLPAVSIDFSDHPLSSGGHDLPPMLPPRDVAGRLIRTYFDFGLSTSRFVHEPSLLRVIDALYGGGAWAAELERSSDLALAYMVLALGSHYSKEEDMFSGFAASVRFYQMASTQLARDADRVTLATSQARLLVIHYLLNHARMHEAWSAFGVVVRHVQALGMHRRARLAGAGANRIHHEYRKRLFWAVFVYDRIISSMFGRPCAVAEEDVDQEECALANDEDISDAACRLTDDGVFCSAAALVHYARLARILGRILRELHSPAARLSDVGRLRATAAALQEALDAWQRGLPPYLDYVRLPQSAASVMAQRQMCTLKLMFAHASLLLYRPFILHAIDSSSSSSSASSLSSPSKRDRWVKECHDRAITAANTVVSECRYLAQRGLFSRVFWLVNYTQFAAIGTLFMYSYLWPENAGVRQTAERALDQFPAGIDGDLVGQRYLETLKELRDMTAAPSPAAAYQTLPQPTEQGGELPANANANSGWLLDDAFWPNALFDPVFMDDFAGSGENQ